MQRNTRMILIALAAVGTLLSGVGLAMAHGGALGRFGGTGSAFTVTDGQLDGTYVDATFDAATATLTDVTLTNGNASTLLASRVSIAVPEGANMTATAGRGGYRLDDGQGNVAHVEDSPRAGLRVASASGTTVTIVLPEGATVARHEEVAGWSPAGATITYADGTKASLVLRNATLAENASTLVITVDPAGTLAYAVTPEGGFALGGACAGPMGAGMGMEYGPRGGHGGRRHR